MLNRRHRTARATLALVCVTAALVIGSTTPSVAAGPEDCPDGRGSFVNGVLKCDDSSTTVIPGNQGSSGNNTPAPCDLDSVKPGPYDQNRSANFCDGLIVCYTKDLLPPYALPDGDKPKEDSVGRGTWCVYPDAELLVRSFWSDDEEPPSLLEQARSAVDALDFTTPAVGVSPQTRTLVNLDTWFWLDGVQQTVTASAFTLTATATLSSVTVDPGDGSGSFTCSPVPTSAAAAEQSCIHRYRKASLRGRASVEGRPAYAARVTSTYDLVFTNGGAATTIPGAPATIDGAPATTAVRVDEVQSVVRPRR